jgi:ABC-2 type transport system ATP-binding protein
MTHIELDNVCIEFPVLNSRDQYSIKNVVLSRARGIGGRIVDDGIKARSVRALENISLKLKEGDRLGLVGHNGSGKTTLLRVIGGVFAPASGRVDVSGKCMSMFDIGIGIDAEATGYENIAMRGLILGLTQRQIADKTAEIADFSELGPYLELPVRTYSSGMAMRLMFSIATSIEGNIVLMDEWIAVGDKEFREKANERLKQLTDRAGILVIASHEPNMLRKLCNVGLSLEGGRVKHFGPIDKVLEYAG